jgi:hypothetical protein
LICGDSILIDCANVDVLIGRVHTLENSELGGMVLRFFEECEGLRVSNCISRLHQKMRFGVGINRETAFVGGHISEFDADALRQLGVTVLSEIIGSESLRIPSEDWLFKLILDLGRSFSSLIGEVRFESLSPGSIDSFFRTFLC